jgi:hypothetical protein
MPNAKYYREQASLLARWSIAASSREVAERLMKRSQEMAFLAQRTDASIQTPPEGRDTCPRFKSSADPI